MFRTVFFIALFLLPNLALAQTFKLPDTWQTKCYNTSGATIACTGTGQDGEYSINPMSYTDNGNGTITDNVTGLMWQKGENSSLYNWYHASGTYNVSYNPSSQNICGSLELAGYSDWRLPTKKELITLIDYSIPNPMPTINTAYFPNTHAINYWSLTIYASSTGSSAWSVNFGYGYVSSLGVSGGLYVRCVRGAKTSPSFTNNGNGTATDNGTGLMWQQGEQGKKTWVDALTYCEGLSLGGQNDWRLPNIKELESITDDTKYGPAIDTTYFPNTYADGYWSSTTLAGSTGNVWAVSFSLGVVGSSDKSGYNRYIMCVRGGQAGSSTQNNYAATLSSDLKLHIPILTFNGQSYWADLQYTSGSNFTLSNAGAVTDTSSYSGCTAATLSSSYKLHIPALTYNNISYWADFQYVPDATFTLTGAAAN